MINHVSTCTYLAITKKFITSKPELLSHSIKNQNKFIRKFYLLYTIQNANTNIAKRFLTYLQQSLLLDPVAHILEMMMFLDEACASGCHTYYGMCNLLTLALTTEPC